MNTYIVALIESLEKKVSVLEDICKKNEEQAALLKEDSFSFDKFDKNTEEKGILIFNLNKLDEGFESVYEKVKTELDTNKSSYASEIKKMQELITKITDLSTAIQAEETRNKAALENVFRNEKNKLKGQRSGIKAVNSYNQSMNFKRY